MHIETRAFEKSNRQKRKLLLLLPTEKESRVIDATLGDCVKDGNGDFEIKVKGVVKLGTDLTHYIQLEVDK